MSLALDTQAAEAATAASQTSTSRASRARAIWLWPLCYVVALVMASHVFTPPPLAHDAVSKPQTDHVRSASPAVPAPTEATDTTTQIDDAARPTPTQPATF
jgi:hypothetical protein